MGSGFSKMKKQAQALREQFEKAQEELKISTFSGTSGNGHVEIVLNGDKELKKISIKQECVDPSDVEGLQDLIKAAFEDAYKKIDSQSSTGMPSGLPFSF